MVTNGQISISNFEEFCEIVSKQAISENLEYSESVILERNTIQSWCRNRSQRDQTGYFDMFTIDVFQFLMDFLLYLLHFVKY